MLPSFKATLGGVFLNTQFRKLLASKPSEKSTSAPMNFITTRKKFFTMGKIMHMREF